MAQQRLWPNTSTTRYTTQAFAATANSTTISTNQLPNSSATTTNYTAFHDSRAWEATTSTAVSTATYTAYNDARACQAASPTASNEAIAWQETTFTASNGATTIQEGTREVSA